MKANLSDGAASYRALIDPLEPRLLLSGDYSPGEDIVLYWNQVAMDALLVDSRLPAPQQDGPTRASLAAAIVHVAIADAYAGVTGEFSPLIVNRSNPQASIEAAISQAARDTLADQFSQQTATFDTALDNVLDELPNNKAQKQGVLYGKWVAKRVLQSRKHDGSDSDATYVPTGEPGNHDVDPLNPNQGFLTPGWGDVTPFVLADGSQFMPPPFPELTSAAYAEVFNEVKVVGALDAEVSDRDNNGILDRTDDQTEIGLFWGYDERLGSPARLYNEAARVVAVQEGNTVGENARLFGLVMVAMADAGINAWNAKYTYAIWRPILGIRNADLDGNPDTIEDPNWVPLGAPGNQGDPAGFGGAPGPDADPDPVGGPDFTPPFPSYTSGHATFGGAAFTVLINFYEADNIAFDLSSDETGTTRHYDSFSEAIEENSLSRIYLGVHWRIDQEQGEATGEAVGALVFADAYTPLPQDPPPVIPLADGFLKTHGAKPASIPWFSSTRKPGWFWDNGGGRGGASRGAALA